MTNKIIDVKLKRVLALNGKASQVPQVFWVPSGFIEEYKRLEKLYFMGVDPISVQDVSKK